MTAWEQRSVDEVPLHGGRLCLDFANTVAWRLGPSPEDFLVTYADLARWAGRVGVLSDHDERAVIRLTREYPQEAAAALDGAVLLREAIYRLFDALAQGTSPDPDHLRKLGMAEAQAIARGRLEPRGDHFRWTWVGIIDLRRVEWEVVHDALQLLESGDLDRVKECPNHGCGWLFYDHSKNVSRRWCSMAACGNQVKSRRQWERRKAPARYD